MKIITIPFDRQYLTFLDHVYGGNCKDLSRGVGEGHILMDPYGLEPVARPPSSSTFVRFILMLAKLGKIALETLTELKLLQQNCMNV